MRKGGLVLRKYDPVVSSSLKLFVYGSLKTGECNESELSQWLTQAVPAQTKGTLWLRPDGYPALRLSDYGQLGTADYSNDLTLQRAPEPSHGRSVVGQLLWLRCGEAALPRLDDFEGFFPGGRSEYLRVAISVDTEDGLQPCWTYVGAQQPPETWKQIDHWPPPWFQGPPDPYQAFSE